MNDNNIKFNDNLKPSRSIIFYESESKEIVYNIFDYVYIPVTSQPITEIHAQTSPSNDPIMGSERWIVARGSFKNYCILNNKLYLLPYTTYTDVNTLQPKHSYNIVHYQTVSSAYQGTNLWVVTTWTQLNVLDQV